MKATPNPTLLQKIENILSAIAVLVVIAIVLFFTGLIAFLLYTVALASIGLFVGIVLAALMVAFGIGTVSAIFRVTFKWKKRP